MSKNGRQIILDKVKSSKFRNAIVKVTKRCNLNCKYCYIEHKNQDLPINLLKIFLKQAIPLGLKQIYFHGGEPLLMPISYYKEIANFLKKNYPDENIKMDLVTNGTLIIKEIIEEFKKMGIGIGVSIAGFLADPSRKRPSGILIRCSECKNKYRIHMKVPKIRCPICNAILVIKWDRN